MPFALTFDDGPGPSMPALLDVLRAASVRATFFVIGRNVEEPRWSAAVDRAQARAMVLRAIVDGHEIGNHSYTHARSRSAEPFMSEVPRVDELIRELRAEAGSDLDSRILVRLPFGDMGGDDRALALRNSGRKPVHWTAIFTDWVPRIPADLCDEMLTHVRERERRGQTAVLTLHVSSEVADFERPWTVEAVQMFLAEAKRQRWTSEACPG